MKKRLVVGNIKMNLLSIRERDAYIRSLRALLRRFVAHDVDVAICPPDMYVEAFSEAFERMPISLGVQNIFWERKGAYTGELSATMAREFGVRFAIVGHSERRLYLEETDEMVSKKAACACEEGLEAIVCVGENAEERYGGVSGDRVRKQLSRSLVGFPRGKIENLIIAYEPVWSVGTGQTPETHDIVRMHEVIRDEVSRIFGSGAGSYVRVLYGGSVGEKNIERVCLDADMDGVLVGGASLRPEEFMKIVEKVGGE